MVATASADRAASLGTVVKCPQGKTVLVDCGSSGEGDSEAVKEYFAAKEPTYFVVLSLVMWLEPVWGSKTIVEALQRDSYCEDDDMTAS